MPLFTTFLCWVSFERIELFPVRWAENFTSITGDVHIEELLQTERLYFGSESLESEPIRSQAG